MPSKKKPRPLFEVPDDIEPGGESGWVYRSAPGTEYREYSENAREEGPGTSMTETGTTALALGLAAIAQTMVLGLTITAIPLTLGIRAMRLLRPE